MQLVYETSVSKTIRKAPLAEVQTTLRKPKIRFMERRYLSHYRNSVKICFLVQNFTEIGKSGAESRDCHRVPNWNSMSHVTKVTK